MTNKNVLWISLVGLYLVITGLSYLAFTSFIAPSRDNPNISQPSNVTPLPSTRPGILTFSGPKTAICPLNGLKYTEDEKKIWSERRPLAVMIENHADARPLSGLSMADVVYEAIAEGGITRFMAVYYCQAVAGAGEAKYDVGPVRSARTYFLDIASEYSDYPLYTHVGGANCSAPIDPVSRRVAGACTTDRRAQAIEQISDYGWNNKGTWGDLSQFSLSYKVCRREPERTGEVKDTEHTMYCSTKELWNIAASRGLTNLTEVKSQSWDVKFQPWSATLAESPAATPEIKSFSFDFWPGYKDYSVSWIYDSKTNRYARQNGGAPHLDFNSGETITAKNVVVQFAPEVRSIDVHGHNLYKVIGTGKGVLFQNGVKTDITWSKPNRLSRTVFKTVSGAEVNFVPGNIWIEILPFGNQVSYENTPQS
ncbi:MAG: DUF3048 domain-containing protein [Candidatus Shapirobacteria bacterium]